MNFSCKQMKKTNLLTFAVLLGACGLSATAAAPGNRVIYGFNRASGEWASETKEYDCGFVSYPFDLSETGTVLKSYLDNPNVSIYAGAAIDGIFYGCEYEFVTSTQQPTALDLVSYNIYNGHKEHIGQWNPEQSYLKPSDMTYNPVDGKLYAMGFDGESGLYEVDITTGQFKLLYTGPLGATLACDAKGTLYTIDDGVLYSLNIDRHRRTRVFDTKLSGMTRHQSMEFDHTTGKLYWASCTTTHPLGDENVYLQEIDLSDPNNITMTEIGMIGLKSTFVSMYIPSADAIDAPAAPSNITSAVAADGVLSTTLSWTNPTEAFGGGDCGDLYGVVIKRDGETVKTFSKSDIAATMTYTDNVDARGNYRYDIQAINGAGAGAKGTVFQYIGADKPGYVENLKGKINEGMSSVTLSWTAPTESYLGGSFDPADVTYNVVRSDGSTLASKITETTFTDDKIRRLNSYSYTVEAVNAEGATGLVAGPFIIGPARELPLEQTFENSQEITKMWTAVDGNNDSFSWMFGTTLGHAIFGDYESCAEYIVSPTLGNTMAADEWLITPPLKFEADTEYEITVSARCYGYDQETQGYADETVDVYFGTTNTVEGMTEKIGTFTVGDNGIDEATGTRRFVKYSTLIPVVKEETAAAVGLRLVSPLRTASYFQTNNISIGLKGQFSGIENVAVDGSEVKASISNGVLTIVGKFGEAELYNLQGVCVARINSAVTDLNHLAKGVYVLRAGKASIKLAK